MFRKLFEFLFGRWIGRGSKEEIILRSVEVVGRDHKGDTFHSIIYIPPGWKFVKKFASDDMLLDQDGNIQKIYEWKLGYSLVYTYHYFDNPLIPLMSEKV